MTAISAPWSRHVAENVHDAPLPGTFRKNSAALSASPMQASEVISRTPFNPRSLSCLRNAPQPVLYQSSDWVTCGCPIAARDGHDFPRLIDERVPGVAAVIDDVVEGFENSVRQPVLPHELPDIFLAV